MQPGTKKKISYFAKRRSTKSQTPGFSLTRHKKPGKCGIFGGVKRAGFSLRTDLRNLGAVLQIEAVHNLRKVRMYLNVLSLRSTT